MLRYFCHGSRRSNLLGCLLVGVVFLTFWNSESHVLLRIQNKDGRLVCSGFHDVAVHRCHDGEVTKWSGLEFNPATNYSLQPNCLEYGDADLVMVIMSKTQEFGLRMAARESYALANHWKGIKVRRIFVVGLPAAKNPEDSQENVIKESLKEGDVLQVPIREGLYSSSRQMIAVLYWLQSCACRTKFILKIGRNVIPNIFLIQKALDDTKSEIKCVSKSQSVERDNRKKNYIRTDEYSPDEFPMFCESDTFLLKMETAMQLLKTAEERDIFKLEGPYITGLLRKSSCILIEKPQKDAVAQHIRSQRIPLKIEWNKVFLVHLNDKHVANYLTFWEDMLYKMTGK